MPMLKGLMLEIELYYEKLYFYYIDLAVVTFRNVWFYVLLISLFDFNKIFCHFSKDVCLFANLADSLNMFFVFLEYSIFKKVNHFVVFVTIFIQYKYLKSFLDFLECIF